jgi:hypothetical protein
MNRSVWEAVCSCGSQRIDVMGVAYGVWELTCRECGAVWLDGPDADAQREEKQERDREPFDLELEPPVIERGS